MYSKKVAQNLQSLCHNAAFSPTITVRISDLNSVLTELEELRKLADVARKATLTPDFIGEAFGELVTVTAQYEDKVYP